MNESVNEVRHFAINARPNKEIRVCHKINRGISLSMPKILINIGQNIDAWVRHGNVNQTHV